MGASGGPITWSFWVKTRTAAADAMLGSFTPFYVNAVRLAVSTNFVLYRDSLEATLTAGQAASVLATMETAYTNLRNVYGGGEHPYANNNARVVILAYNIKMTIQQPATMSAVIFLPVIYIQMNLRKRFLLTPWRCSNTQANRRLRRI
jgi:hypothetical protein